MIQQTVERFNNICPETNFWVVTGERYVDLVREQLPQIPREQILAEPCARNTAPCIAFAAWKIMKRHPDANLIFTPSDALVTDIDEFRRIMTAALEFTQSGERIVTVGIKPTRPETGYGYIEVAESDDAADDKAKQSIVKVASFREKPDLATAKTYLDAGSYLWNAGIFVWSVGTIVSSIRRYAGGIASVMDDIAKHFYADDEAAAVAELFPTCEKISIDYAVMEKADYIYTLPADFGWSDVGTWGSLHTLLPRDEAGNAVVGENVHLVECSGCIVHAQGADSVVLQGLKDCVAVVRDGRVLVCSLSKEQHIKDWEK